MDYREQFVAMLTGPEPILALAPMQDVTDLAFWRVMHQYGGADVYATEYFRVYPESRLDKNVLESIIQNPTGRPLIAQMIGNDIPALVRTAQALQHYPIVAVDLNLGCPAPVVYRKCAGGGLLRDPQHVDAILGALREAVQIKFTVKTRIGFDSPRVFDELLPIFARHSLDLLAVHARTVAERYRPEVHYEYITRAVQAMACPVLANGNVHAAAQAQAILEQTGARGLMIGRGAIRNPWLFAQIRQHRQGEVPTLPTGRQVLDYIRMLYEAECNPSVREAAQVQRMKKFMNFIGEGIEPAGAFLHAIRRVTTKAEFFQICDTHLDHDRPMPLDPVAPAAVET